MSIPRGHTSRIQLSQRTSAASLSDLVSTWFQINSGHSGLDSPEHEQALNLCLLLLVFFMDPLQPLGFAPNINGEPATLLCPDLVLHATLPAIVDECSYEGPLENLTQGLTLGFNGAPSSRSW